MSKAHRRLTRRWRGKPSEGRVANEALASIQFITWDGPASDGYRIDWKQTMRNLRDQVGVPQSVL